MKLIVANWKMNPTSRNGARQLFDAIGRRLKGRGRVEVAVCPPFVYLPSILDILSGRKKCQVKLGAQDCFWEEKGAFTGEISPLMLRDLKVKYVIVGHSERRKLIGETDEIINEKLRAVLGANLTPILCIGETAEERKKGKIFQVLEKEIREDLKKVPKSKIEKVVIAYEPIWAIGTNNPCSGDDALTAVLCIRKIVSQIFGKKGTRNIRILYGGSANSKNAQDYLFHDSINGLLVGSASLDAGEFVRIVKIGQSL